MYLYSYTYFLMVKIFPGFIKIPERILFFDLISVRENFSGTFQTHQVLEKSAKQLQKKLKAIIYTCGGVQHAGQHIRLHARSTCKSQTAKPINYDYFRKKQDM